MITRISHTMTGDDPAGLGLALEVAYELHAPGSRAPEVVLPVRAPEMMGLRTSAGHPHRRKVPLGRLSTLRG
ncbi:hypothetical protein [Streptomyces sp. SD15]